MQPARSGLVFFCLIFILLLIPDLLTAQTPAPVAGYSWNWQVVVNNGVVVPGDARKFNSYNQPSINVNRLVVFRARSKGGTTGEPAHGIFTRDMSPSATDSLLRTFFDRKTLVPQPNNLESMFIEPPSFPRIDMWSNTIASRGGHQPTWEYVVSTDPVTLEETTTRVGTTGIYTNPFGSLILGASNLGNAPEFIFFRVPEVLEQPIKFDVFPGAPAVTDGNTIVVKGNYSVPDPSDPTLLIGKTGVYYRTLTNAPIPHSEGDLAPAGGTAPFVLIANSDTLIPGTGVNFGSTAPPSAVRGRAVFAGFDNEDAPTLGGLYLAPLSGTLPPLTALVKIGDRVPGEDPIYTFTKLGEGLSFDGRFVAFWGAWGTETKELILQCPSDGNKNRVKYCKDLYGDGVNPGTVSNGFHTTVPLHQGIFVYDTATGKTRAVAKTPIDFTDFVYWNFSGKVDAPSGGTGGDGGSGEDGVSVAADEGSGGGGGGDMDGGEEDGEPARWRSAAFVAVSGLADGSLTNSNFDVAFKARKGDLSNGAYVNPIDGIYLRKGPGDEKAIVAIVASQMDGTLIDPAATYIPVDEAGNPIPGASPLPLPVTAMGVERDGFRGNALAITVTMANEVAGWAGVYLTTVPATF